MCTKWLFMIALGSTLAYTSCKSSAQRTVRSVDEVVADRLGNQTIVDHNPSHTYALFKQIEKPERMGEAIYFIVIRLKDYAVVAEGSYTRGHVKWISDNRIELLNLPGKVTPDADMTKFRKEIIIDEVKPEY